MLQQPSSAIVFPMAWVPKPVRDWAINWGVDKVARGLALSAMKSFSGVEFFPSRTSLQQRRSLDDLLGTATKIDAVVVIGRTLHETELDNIRHVRRVIFPDPDSASLMHYAGTVDERGHIQRNVCEASRSLLQKKIEVRWYPHMIGNSLLIGDGDKRTGWVHVETIFPFSIPNRRPSWRALRTRHEDLVKSMTEMFKKMWAESRVPEESVIKRYIGNE